MTDENQDRGPNTALYALGTFAYLLVIVLGAWCLGFFNPAGTRIGPSEWGDVLAGMFSPLAFLWLLYAALSQRAELELQRKELVQNNETQAKQQIEMNRQADALIAQTRRLEAQANATYEPVFVLRKVEGQVKTNSVVMITIQNVGGTALNVYSSSYMEPRKIAFGLEHPAAEVTTDVVPYWPAGARVTFMLTMESIVDVDEPMFSFGFRRLDVRASTHRYVIASNWKRIELREATLDQELRIADDSNPWG